MGRKEKSPMLATLIEGPFDDENWLFEIKLDGFRAIADLHGSQVILYSRNFQSFNERFPTLVEDCKKMNLHAVLDGEIVALDKRGISHFQLLQNYKSEQNIYFYLFDILFLNGKDLRELPLIERKKILKKIVPRYLHIRYLDHVEKRGKALFKLCQKMGAEGIIGKVKKSKYSSGFRSKEWVKIKAEYRQEVIICGFTEPRGSRQGFGALIMGLYKNKKLIFVGHVGGGFTEKKLQEIRALLSPLITERCPFAIPPKTNTAVSWVKPKYLCEVKFKEWTGEGIMRMPIFLGLRSDKSVHSVIKESPKR